EVPSDPQVDLLIRRPAELVEPGLYAIDNGPVVRVQAIIINVYRGRDREGTRAFELRQRRELDLIWQFEPGRYDQSMAHIFSRRTMVARTERVADIGDSIDVIEQLSHYCAPCRGVCKRIVGR